MQPFQKEPPSLSEPILQLRADAAELESRIAAHSDDLAQPDDLRTVADGPDGDPMSAPSVWAHPKADPTAAGRAALQAAALHYLDSFNAVDGSLATRARCAQALALAAYDRLCAEATERFT